MTSEWWVMRLIVQRKRPAPRFTARWLDPVSGDEASDEQMAVIQERVTAGTYVVVPAEGICEPLECRTDEASARDLMMALAGKHTGERFVLALVMSV